MERLDRLRWRWPAILSTRTASTEATGPSLRPGTCDRKPASRASSLKTRTEWETIRLHTPTLLSVTMVEGGHQDCWDSRILLTTLTRISRPRFGIQVIRFVPRPQWYPAVAGLAGVSSWGWRPWVVRAETDSFIFGCSEAALRSRGHFTEPIKSLWAMLIFRSNSVRNLKLTNLKVETEVCRERWLPVYPAVHST